MSPELGEPLDPDLKAALRGLRQVRSRRPADSNAFTFASWREDMAAALESLARHLPHEEDRAAAKAEAAEARKQAARIRAEATAAQTTPPVGPPSLE